MEKAITKSLTFPKGLIEEVKEYQKKNYLPSFSATVVALVVKGLRKEEE